VSDTPNPAPAEQNTEPAGDSGEAASGPARETDNATMAELRILRKQLKDAQQRISAADKAAADKAKAEMTELERYKSEADQYRKQAEETQSRFLETQKSHAFKLAAHQAGAVDVNAALKLADLSTLEFEDGQVIGIESALKSLKKSSPYLFGVAANVSAGSGGGNPATGAPAVTTSQIAKMTKAELIAFEAKLARGEIKL
jgi:NADH dehydrogenase/NADH:ubiquinone oxidoreductase subunit G